MERELKSLPEWFRRRRGGVLLHPTSLPGPGGIGDLGAASRAWVDWLSRSGCSVWQVLPLGPTGYGDSPYQCFSAFAGNPLLIAPGDLVESGLLLQEELEVSASFPPDRVDFGAVIDRKSRLLDVAASLFPERASNDLKDRLRAFEAEQSFWLDDYALFMALKRDHDGRPWIEWRPEYVAREPGAIAEARQRLEDRIERVRIRQFLFFEQWDDVHRRARQAGIAIVGDVPIFVAQDSADVWANAALFHLDSSGRPTVVAGVPPDYFSETGQRWGNPLYKWESMRADGYAWWIARLKSMLEMVDVVRLDHFRGFEGYWEVPAESPTAETGRWVPGPGETFLDRVRDEFGSMPLLAEDLGVITPEVVELRQRYNLPGMKVLQFAFDSGPTNPFLPHNYTRMAVAYTGTHDNDTSRGWYQTAEEAEQDYCRRYLMTDGDDIAWDLIRAAWSSVANWAIAPLQDVLSLDRSARMNFPGRSQDNWVWRARREQLTSEVADRLRDLSQRYGRLAPGENGEEA